MGLTVKEGDKVHRSKRGRPLGHGEDDEPIGPEETVTRVHSWKWMKVDNNGEAHWVRCDEYEEA